MNSEIGFKTLLRIDSLFTAFSLAFYLLVLILRLLTLTHVYPLVILIIMAFLSIVCGFLVGVEFPLANKLYLEKSGKEKHRPNILYAVDMLGSFAGAVLVCILLIPQFGILPTIILLFGLKSCLLFLLGAATNKTL